MGSIGWERSIALGRTTKVTLCQANQDQRALLWVGEGRSEATVFVPLRVPLKPYSHPLIDTGSNWQVSDNLWWTTVKLGNLMELKWNRIQPVVALYQKLLEDVGLNLAIRLKSMPDEDAQIAIDNHLEKVNSGMKNLYDDLLVRFQGGFDIRHGTAHLDGYPEFWLEKTGYYNSKSIKPESLQRLYKTIDQQQKIATAIKDENRKNLLKTKPFGNLPFINMLQSVEELMHT